MVQVAEGLGLDGDFALSAVMMAVASAGAEIAGIVATGPITSAGSRTGVANASGDDMTTMDVLSDKVFTAAMLECGSVGIMCSEEAEGPIPGTEGGEYAICFDPLDGSSNVASSMPTGTFFAVWKIADPKNPSSADLLQTGTAIVAAGYILYSSATVMMASLGNGHGVHSFALQPATGRFVRTGAVSMPENPKKIISANAGRSRLWGVEPAAFMQSAIGQEKPYTYRYTGAAVADIHRTLLDGGVFFYPGDRDYPNGKLRVLYECFPMAFLMEAAGGGAKFEVPALGSDCDGRLLEIVPTDLHQRTPIFVGCNRDIALFSALTGAREQQAVRSNEGAKWIGHESILGTVSEDWGEDPEKGEIAIKRGQLITKIVPLSDPKWLTITLVTGERGLVPTKTVNRFGHDA